MQVATAFAHLIEQLDGSGRYPVRFVGSLIPVHTSNTMRYRIDFKHFGGCDATFFNDYGCRYPVLGQINHKLAFMPNVPDSPTPQKACSICGVSYSLAEFSYYNRVNRSYCRSCDKFEKEAYARGGVEAARRFREEMRNKWRR